MALPVEAYERAAVPAERRQQSLDRLLQVRMNCCTSCRAAWFWLGAAYSRFLTMIMERNLDDPVSSSAVRPW